LLSIPPVLIESTERTGKRRADFAVRRVGDELSGLFEIERVVHGREPKRCALAARRDTRCRI
jgi:hypothetical protein